MAPGVGFHVLEVNSGSQRTSHGPCLWVLEAQSGWKGLAHPDPLVWDGGQEGEADRKGRPTVAEEGGRLRCGAQVGLVPRWPWCHWSCFLALWWAHVLRPLPG